MVWKAGHGIALLLLATQLTIGRRYIKNALLNFNLVVLFAMLSLPVTVMSTGIRLRAKDLIRSILLQFGVYLWLVCMSAIPHKGALYLRISSLLFSS